MRKYLKVFDVGIQNTFVYRWNFLFRALFGLIPLLGTLFVWSAIFAARRAGIENFNYDSVVYYFLLVLILDGLISPGDDEWQVAADIRDGQMNAFLTKPVNYLVYRLALFVSNRLLYSLVTLPISLTLFLIFHRYLFWPSSWGVWALTALSLIFAALIQFLISYSVALFAFWMLEISTVVFIVLSFEYFLSGHMFPLAFMPDAVQAILKFSPFPYELYFPIAVFMGKVHDAELWRGLVIQFGWVLLTLLLANTLWRRGLSRYQAVGG
jgi:ABC-2 type transport system permease protein